MLTGIGIIHRGMEQYDNALEYARRALEAFEEIGEESAIRDSLINLGNVHINLGEPENQELPRREELIVPCYAVADRPVVVMADFDSPGRKMQSLSPPRQRAPCQLLSLSVCTRGRSKAPTTVRRRVSSTATRRCSAAPVLRSRCADLAPHAEQW